MPVSWEFISFYVLLHPSHYRPPLPIAAVLKQVSLFLYSENIWHLLQFVILSIPDRCFILHLTVPLQASAALIVLVTQKFSHHIRQELVDSSNPHQCSYPTTYDMPLAHLPHKASLQDLGPDTCDVEVQVQKCHWRKFSAWVSVGNISLNMFMRGAERLRKRKGKLGRVARDG